MTAAERREHVERLRVAVRHGRVRVEAGPACAGYRWKRRAYFIDARVIAERMAEALPDLFGGEAVG